MEKEYVEFYRDESPIPGSNGSETEWSFNDSGVINGGWEGLFGGLEGEFGSNSQAPIGAEEVRWKFLATLRWEFLAPGILKNPSTGKVFKNAGKILKTLSSSCSLRIEIGIMEEFEWHLDCVILKYVANKHEFNMSETAAVAENFFSRAFLDNLDSELILALKWQKGHYPLSISSVWLKITDEKTNYGVVQNVALSKKFRNTGIVKIKNRKMEFIRIEG